MKLISHRGNLKGPIPELENKPEYINDALFLGYDVEIDVWVVDGYFWLGHDKPQYRIDYRLLLDRRLWCHAKNLESLRRLLEIGAHVFWHENDQRTLTSKGFVWTYPGKDADRFSIIVQQGPIVGQLPDVGGICSDYVDDIKAGF